MIQILILADDITGSLDTGVKFAAGGAITKIATDRTYDFSKTRNTDVLVINMETRHITPQEAYQVIYEIVGRAVDAGIPHIYKKTDSALRGNIGSELSAMLDASKESILPFLPAYPQMNRTTVKGIHYIGKIPVHESEFGKDPFEPVTSSFIPDIIQKQSEAYIETVPLHGEIAVAHQSDMTKGIYIFDSKTDEDLLRIGQVLIKGNHLKIMAGCAGFASVLPNLLEIEGKPPQIPALSKKLLIICGSVNNITRKQLDYAEEQGFWRGHLSTKQKVEKGFYETESGKKSSCDMIEVFKKNDRMILDSGDEESYQDTISYAIEKGLSLNDIRIQITENFAALTSILLEAEKDMTLMIIGGDTLIGFLKRIQCCELMPICELEQGTVLSKLLFRRKELYVISKSGGFGGKELIVNLAERIMT